MKRFIEGADRGQSTLFPERLDDFICREQPGRVVEAFVEGPSGVPPIGTVEALYLWLSEHHMLGPPKQPKSRAGQSRFSNQITPRPLLLEPEFSSVVTTSRSPSRSRSTTWMLSNFMSPRFSDIG